MFYYRAAKEQKKGTKTTKKVTAPAKAKPAPKQKVSKNLPKAAPRVGGKR